MKFAKLEFTNCKLKHSEIPKLRGYVGNVFKDYNLIHNHRENGKSIYRYPLIQFKIINDNPVMLAYTKEAADIFTKIFISLGEIKIEDRVIPIQEKDLVIKEVECGYTAEPVFYKFITPWIALNQKKYNKFKQTKVEQDKKDLLCSSLTGNILSLSKGIGIWLQKDQIVKVDLDINKMGVSLKGNSLLGFKGYFKANYLLPPWAGLGKSVSRGFGTAAKIM